MGDKLKNFVKRLKMEIYKNKKIFGFLFRYFFVLILPILLYFWIFQPFYNGELPQNQSGVITPQKLSNSDIIRMVVSDIIETPFGLGLRNFCVRNNGIVSINKNPITKELSELSGVGIAKISVKINNEISNDFSVKPGDEYCIPFVKKDELIIYELGQRKTLIKPEENILKKYFSPSEDLTQPEYQFDINFDNVKFFYKKNVYDNWAKGIVFFIFWESLVFLTIKLFKFLKFGYKIM